jgi:hypothetical protein
MSATGPCLSQILRDPGPKGQGRSALLALARRLPTGYPDLADALKPRGENDLQATCRHAQRATRGVHRAPHSEGADAQGAVPGGGLDT